MEHVKSRIVEIMKRENKPVSWVDIMDELNVNTTYLLNLLNSDPDFVPHEEFDYIHYSLANSR